MKFSAYNISKSILSQLEEMDFKKPTDIQYKAIPYILKGEDVMAVAQTGTGKTAAFVIPILERIITNQVNRKHLSCLVMVPTRELCLQISDVFKEIGKKTNVKTIAIHGGVDQNKQIDQLLKKADVLVTTPGRMFDLNAQGYLNLRNIQTLVLDESDIMLGLGFKKDIEDLMRYLPKKRQTLFFSATINKKIKSLAYKVVNNAIRIQFSPKNPVSKNVMHSVISIQMDDKRFFLENLINEYSDSSIIVFVRTKIRADRVQNAMNRVGIDVLSIHSGISQEERFSILNAFRKAKQKVLVTTDVTARGIDLPAVEYVVNYDLPDNPENYVHRCGRTGRGRNKGMAISFCSTQEEQLLQEIEHYTGESIEKYDINLMDYKLILKETNDVNSDWKKLMKDFEKENPNNLNVW
ncbi:MAG: DEAD/DEAH box helicase [Crocinitomicaceae bacterium]|nr:DEAD/DEAH box helicase [Crocinitomicaceae bacterium]